MSDADYSKVCKDMADSVSYIPEDKEEVVIEKIQKWPILKECEIISNADFDNLGKLAAEDTNIKSSDSLEALEHKLIRLTTLSKTFVFTEEQFTSKKNAFVSEMLEVDYSSESKLKDRIERILVLKKCSWIDEAAYEAKKAEVVQNIKRNDDAVVRMQLFRLLTDIKYITETDYNTYKAEVIDAVFSQYTDISELQKKAKVLMDLKEAGVITDSEFADYKKKLLAL